MTHRLIGVKGAVAADFEALMPCDANAQRMMNKPQDPKFRTTTTTATATATATAPATAQLRVSKEKDHPPPPPPEVIEPPSGDRPDGAVYTVGKLLGKGGFAVCYHGMLQTNRQRVALKIVKSQMPPKMEQKFQTELQIHSKMRHKYIVQFFRAFAFDNCTYLALELCPNGSLMDMVKRRKGLTEPEVRFYTVQVAGAIKYMHSKGIIHRDLKMGNIFLDANMNAKIGDFGLAALMVTGRDMQTIRRTTLCGTPNYIAPEILEKGKKGHDHMVDIWSLGIIMFAMLTSKPPFQSSTTDEIYRRARERDYEWPQAEALTGRPVSGAAKDLVAIMLQDAEERPGPDEIVQHPFFTSGYMPVPADISYKLRELPPDRSDFYIARPTAALCSRSAQTLREMCTECGVGPWGDTQVVHGQVWKEMAAEEKAGMTPAIPLAPGLVYRPFDKWAREQREMERRFGHLGVSSSSSSSSSSSAAAVASAMFEVPSTSASMPPLPLLRQPPQSFAAQQRALSRPVALPAGLPAAPKWLGEKTTSAAVMAMRPKARERDTVGTMTTAGRNPLREEAMSRPQETFPRPRKTIKSADSASTSATATRDGKESIATDPGAASTADSNAPPRTKEPVPRRARAVPATAAAQVKSADTEARDRRRAAPQPSVVAENGDQEVAATAAAAAAAAIPSRVTIFSSAETPQEVMATRPGVVLDRLRRLETELDRALNSRTMAFVSSRTVTPRHPHMVVKWVDYTNKFGLGFILNNGSVGCMLRDLQTTESGKPARCPASLVLVRDAVTHFQRQRDATYADRHQPASMSGHRIRFFEHGGERGLSEVAVDPEMFRIPVNTDDDTPGKMKPGKDVFEHRKRERVIVWKRFANYMMAKGRDESILIDDLTGATTEDGNAELVIFYQSFGDVRCWVFGDGHLQFNFPDHTKIALDPQGVWCHFWHLPADAAERLARTGTLGTAALDKRSALTYPLQTLLNFQAKPTAGRGGRATTTTTTTTASSSSTSTRRRPEIPVEMQGIPAANDFRRKVEFIRKVVHEWVSNEGLGNSVMTREERLLWTGVRERGDDEVDGTEGIVPTTASTTSTTATSSSSSSSSSSTSSSTSPSKRKGKKHVWVTLGARWGDRRAAALVDPRHPEKLGLDIDETKRRE